MQNALTVTCSGTNSHTMCGWQTGKPSSPTLHWTVQCSCEPAHSLPREGECCQQECQRRGNKNQKGKDTAMHKSTEGCCTLPGVSQAAAPKPSQMPSTTLTGSPLTRFTTTWAITGVTSPLFSMVNRTEADNVCAYKLSK